MSYLVVAGRSRPPIAQAETDALTWAAHNHVEAEDLYGECICAPEHCRDAAVGLEPVCAACAHRPADHGCRAIAA